MPSRAKDMMKEKSHLEYPSDWEGEAEEFLSDTEMGFEEAPSRPTFPTTLFVYGLPKVPKGGEECRFAKLEKAIKKKLSMSGDAENPGFELEMYIDDKTKESQGCAWFKYPNKNQMEKGRARIEGYKFGKDVGDFDRFCGSFFGRFSWYFLELQYVEHDSISSMYCYFTLPI